jgi:hypothetical protein
MRVLLKTFENILKSFLSIIRKRHKPSENIHEKNINTKKLSISFLEKKRLNFSNNYIWRQNFA